MSPDDTFRRIVQLVLAFIVLDGGSAFGASIKFCFKVDGTFIDNDFALPGGTTEDHWVLDELRRVAGTKVIIKIGTTTYFDGTLGDGLGSGDPGVGCTSTMTVPQANSTYQFQLYSSDGKIDNNSEEQHTLNAKVDDDDDTIHDINLLIVWAHTEGAGTFDVDLDGEVDEINDLWRLHATAGYVLRRTGRWADPAIVDVFADLDTDAIGHYEDGDVFINVISNGNYPIGISRKFVIAHEMGHLLADQYASAVGGDCDLVDEQCGASVEDGHTMSSKEYQTCAFTEGIANFFSAATWNEFNSPSERNCVYGYLNFNSIDCEGSLQSEWPEAFMETVCYMSSSTDRGVELDWLRQFWDVKTDGSIPNFGDMMDWVYEAYVLESDFVDPYDQLSDAAITVGGSIQSNWEDADEVNGIDW